MADSILVAVPLLVLAVVLLLGFAGCKFEHGVAGPAEAQTLTFRAKVPAGLTVVAPGVRFTWDDPFGTPGTTTVPPSPASIEEYIKVMVDLGPSVLWTLGSFNGLTDRSPNGHDGTPLGGVMVGGYSDGPTDFPDATATLFDGTDNGIGSSYNPFVGTTARTFVGWARWDTGGPAEYTLFGSSAGDNNRPNLRLVAANRNIRWLPSGDDGQVVTWSAAAPVQATWFMWALRADVANANATLFIDETKISEQPIAEAWPTTPGTFQAAVGATNRHPFKGAKGLVAVYEKSLTDSEVNQLYQAAHGVRLYEYQLPSPYLGIWAAGCDMTVQADSQTAHASSQFLGTVFTLDDLSRNYVLSFQAEGSPLAPPFTVSNGVLTHD